MKEATGELNVTVVVVILIGLLSALFFSFVWPNLRENFRLNSKCSEAICEDCKSHNCKYVTCHSPGKTDTLKCPYKG